MLNKKFCFVLLFYILLLSGELQAGALDDIVSVESDGGIKALLIERQQVPVVNINITFKNAGYASDPDGKSGLALLAAKHIEEGYLSRNRELFLDKLDRKGIIVGAGVGIDNLSINIKALSQHVDLALAEVFTMLADPRVDVQGFSRMKEEQLFLIKGANNNPGAIASDNMYRKIFAGMSYENTPYGTKESIENIKSEDIVSYIKRVFNRFGIIISVVGDIDPVNLVKLLDARSAEFSRLSLVKPAVAIPNFNFKDAVQSLDQVSYSDVKVPQSSIIFVQEGVPYKHDDYHTYVMLKALLVGTGLSGGALMEELREKKGYVYGVGIQDIDSELISLAKGSTYTDNTNVNGVLSEMENIYRSLQQGGFINKSLLDIAKKKIVSSYIFSLTNSQTMLSILAKMQLYNISQADVLSFPAKISAVKVCNIKELANRFIAWDNLRIFVAGDLEQIRGS